MAKNAQHKSVSYARFGYFFVAPFIIAYCIFSLYPLLTTFWYSATNMKSTIAQFWGFSDKEVYYDRYLDLTTLYTTDFDGDVGIASKEYAKVRKYFDIQEAAEKNDPLNEEGVKAIIEYGANDIISQTAIDELQACLDAGSLSKLSETSYNELIEWNSQFSNIETTVLGALKSQYSAIEEAATVASEASESESETETITADAITTSDDYEAFIETLKSGEFDENQQILMAYLAEKVGYASLADYFEAVKSGEASVEDPNFYYVISNLESPNATYYDEEAGKDTTIASISVPFSADVVTYLNENVWSTEIPALNSYSKLSDYINSVISLHDNEEQLYEDLVALNDMGVIKGIAMKVENGALVESTEESSKNLITLYRQYIDENYQTNEVEIKASAQIAKMATYFGVAADSKVGDLVLNGNNFGDESIHKYISFDGSTDADKYYEYKEIIGMADVLTLDKYKELDEARKAKNVEDAKAKIAEDEAQLDEAKAAYEAAEKAYNDAGAVMLNEDGTQSDLWKEYLAAMNAYKSLTVDISTQESTVNNPTGILTKVDSTSEYITIGLQNYTEIFTNNQRFTKVAGAFVTTVTLWVIGFIPQILLALILSAWFTDTKLHLKGLNAMKALMYLPNVITAATIAILFKRTFAYTTNEAALPAVQRILVDVFHKEPYDFLNKAWPSRFLVCFINFWMWYGNTMIVLIAGITSINESIYESAQLDGASSTQTYVKITLPLLRPMILYTLVTSMIGGLQMYDIPFNLNMKSASMPFNGSYIKSLETILIYINNQAFGKQAQNQVGIASAVAVLLFIVTVILSLVVFYIMRDKDAAKAKKLLKKGGTK